MNRQQLQQFITEFYQAWKVRDETKIPSFYDENLIAYSDFTKLTLQDILNRLEFSKDKFSEVNYNIQDQFIDEEQGKVSVRMKQHHIRKDGGVTKWESIMLYTIKNYKITELWMSFYPNAVYLNND